MTPLLPSPMESPFWGWRVLVRGWAAIALFAIVLLPSVFCPTDHAFQSRPSLWRAGAIAAWCGRAYLVSDDAVPRVDPATGMVRLPDLSVWDDRWNEAVLAVQRRGAPASPNFGDRVIDPVTIAAAFDRDPGIDMGDGSRAFRIGDLRVSVADYDARGCGTGIPGRLRCGDRSFPTGRRILRVLRPDGWPRRPLDSGHSRGLAWLPHMTAVRAHVSDDARTLWLRGTDVESQRWIITADLVTATVIQIDPDPAE